MEELATTMRLSYLTAAPRIASLIRDLWTNIISPLCLKKALLLAAETSLSTMFTQMSRRQVGWQQFLSRFDYQWEYRKGIYSIADPLSRNPTLLHTVIHGTPEGPSQELLQKIKEGYAKDAWFQLPENIETLRHTDGLYLKIDQILVPSDKG
jgi:hypothetical protein